MKPPSAIDSDETPIKGNCRKLDLKMVRKFKNEMETNINKFGHHNNKENTPSK